MLTCPRLSPFSPFSLSVPTHPRNLFRSPTAMTSPRYRHVSLYFFITMHHGHSARLHKPACNSDFIAGSFWHCVIGVWNSRLPNNVAAANLSEFITVFQIVLVLVVVVDLIYSASTALIVPLRRKKVSFQSRSEAVSMPSRVLE